MRYLFSIKRLQFFLRRAIYFFNRPSVQRLLLFLIVTMLTLSLSYPLLVAQLPNLFAVSCTPVARTLHANLFRQS